MSASIFMAFNAGESIGPMKPDFGVVAITTPMVTEPPAAAEPPLEPELLLLLLLLPPPELP